MTAEVLVVDDEPGAAETFARYVQTATRLRTLYADDIQTALSIVRDEGVKVVILDQRMETGPNLNTTGTELAKQIYKIDRNVRCMIFSGQSRMDDVLAAGEQRLTFRDKSQLEELPGLVHVLRAEYLTALANTTDTAPTVIWENRTPLSFRTSVKVELLAVENVAPAAETREEEYHEILLLTPAKSTMTYAAQQFDEQEVRLEQEERHDLGTKIALKAALMQELSASLTETLRTTTTSRRLRRRETSSEVTFSLTDKDIQDGIVSCSIRQAPLYLRRRAIVRSTCSCCGIQSVTGVEFREWTGQFDRRRHDVFSDKTTRIIELGPD